MTKKNILSLYQKKEECCGCAACMAVCRHNAITMQEDEEGFLYPFCDSSKCVGCFNCKKACLFKKYESNQTFE